MIDSMDEFSMARLAREMAMCIRNYKDIFADFGITEEDFYEIGKNDFYKRAKEQFSLEWNSTLSTADRVKLTSAAGAEQGLLTITKRMLDPHEPFPGVLSAFKQLCQNAGIGDPKTEQKSTEKFVITINLGSDLEGKPIIEHYDKQVAIEDNPVKPENYTVDKSNGKG